MVVHQSVSTDLRPHAVCPTAISSNSVAVVTDFVSTHHSISASREGTVAVAPVTVYRVPIVARLSRADDSIATYGVFTVYDTGVAGWIALGSGPRTARIRGLIRRLTHLRG